ncbi:MAG: NTP transferase domain-containing protein [Alysiella sp.]|nr:NTP transferase domain-containing protein [Alysiella sp.]
MNTAIITARANSKGIPRKNLQTVGGISLLAHTILAAQQSGVFQRIIVSTDGEELAQHALQYQAEVIIRPDELASDNARSIDAVCHALQQADIQTGTATLLQPTSPLRRAHHIQAAFQLYDPVAKGSVVSACIAEHHPYKILLAENGSYRAVRQTDDLESPRQALPDAYRPNGAIYINDTAKLLQYRRFFLDPVQLYLMNETDSLDIDNAADLERANHLLKQIT